MSYSHEDRAIFTNVSDSLTRLGVGPWSDADLAAGRGFTEQIQTNIGHSHVFVPILTPRSHARGWVHQEIGYAVAMRIPCVPICVGKVPDGMIAMAQAIVIDEDLVGLDRKLLAVDFARLVEQAGRHWVPPGQAALEPVGSGTCNRATLGCGSADDRAGLCPDPRWNELLQHSRRTC
jgi:hypothetical protein